MDKAVPEQFRSFSWSDLNEWTDGGSIKRGKGYVGSVSDVAITDDNHVIATVSGTDDYATEIWFGDNGLEGRCTCPVGSRCKHAVALILKCIDILGANGSLPVAEEDDDRIAELREDDFDEEYGDSDDSLDEEERDDDGECECRHGRGSHGCKVVPDKPADELEAHIDGLDETAAKRMIREILAEHRDIRADWLRRVKTERGDVAQLLKMARTELRHRSREEAWANPWKHEYHIPDYSPLRRILEKLLNKKAFDELVSFGDSLKAETLPQIESCDDEGDTAGQICFCMEVVAKAVRKSSLSSVEQLRWFADLHDEDDYATFDDIYNPYANPGDWKTSDWSALADIMLSDARKESDNEGRSNRDTSYYAKERQMERICDTLANANRDDEARRYKKDWFRQQGRYGDLAKFLMKEGATKAAWDVAIEGFSAKNAHDPYGRLKEELRRILREIATARGDSRLALSLQAEDFLSSPSAPGFLSLLEAAKPEGLDIAIRPWLVRFLETGLRPDVVPQTSAPKTAQPRRRGRPPKAAAVQPPTAIQAPCPAEPWPLAPSGVPRLPDLKSIQSESGLEILLRVALEEKATDETLLRWKQLKTNGKRDGIFGGWEPFTSFAEEVADALAEFYPDESLAIWNDSIGKRLRFASNVNYAEIVQTFRKMRPVMKRLGRQDEWEKRIREIQAEYKRRPNLVKALEELFGTMAASQRPIVETLHWK